MSLYLYGHFKTVEEEDGLHNPQRPSALVTQPWAADTPLLIRKTGYSSNVGVIQVLRIPDKFTSQMTENVISLQYTEVKNSLDIWNSPDVKSAHMTWKNYTKVGPIRQRNRPQKSFYLITHTPNPVQVAIGQQTHGIHLMPRHFLTAFRIEWKGG
jgi:hypothetical protein